MTTFAPGRHYRTTTANDDRVFLVLSSIPIDPSRSRTYNTDGAWMITILHSGPEYETWITTFEVGQIESYKCQEVRS
jgi:hypothetical protein